MNRWSLTSTRKGVGHEMDLVRGLLECLVTMKVPWVGVGPRVGPEEEGRLGDLIWSTDAATVSAFYRK